MCASEQGPESQGARYKIRKLFFDQADQIAFLFAVVVLGFRIKDLWYFGDDWAFILDRTEFWRNGNLVTSILEPHGNHLYGLTALLFSLIVSLVGIDHTSPFVVALLGAHVLCGSATLNLAKRLGASLLPRALFAFVLAFSGSGAENLVWFFQVGFMSGFGFMLWAIVLLLSNDRPSKTRLVSSSLLLCLGLFSAGTALPLLPVAFLTCVRRAGVARALFYVAAPATLYVLWLLTLGQGAQTGAPFSPLSLGSYMSFGFSSAVGSLVPVTGLAVPIVLVALVAVLRVGGPFAFLSPLLLVAAFMFLAIVGLGRAGLGAEQAGASRYAYITTLLVSPIIILGWSLLRDHLRSLEPVVFVLYSIVLLGSVGQFEGHLASRTIMVEESRSKIVTAARYSVTDNVVDFFQPEPVWNPNVTLNGLRRLVESGLFDLSKVAPNDFSSTITLLLGTNVVVVEERIDGGVGLSSVGPKVSLSTLRHGVCVRLIRTVSDGPIEVTVDAGVESFRMFGTEEAGLMRLSYTVINRLMGPEARQAEPVTLDVKPSEAIQASIRILEGEAVFVLPDVSGAVLCRGDS